MINNPEIAIKTITTRPVSETIKREELERLLTTRLQKLWGYSKETPDKARVLLRELEQLLDKYKKTIGRADFDDDKLDDIVTTKPHLDADHLLNGLSQIPKLSTVLMDVVQQPIVNRMDNLTRFKAIVRSSLYRHAPNYVYFNNQIFADFTVNPILFRKRKSLSNAGYNDRFIIALTSAMVSMHLLIAAVEQQSAIMTNLQTRVLTALMKAEANQQKLIRKQYESCFAIYGSVLTAGPIQYLALALSTFETLMQCYIS